MKKMVSQNTLQDQNAPRLSLLIILTALPLLSVNMFQPSLPAMAQEFSVSFATMNLAIGAYLAVTAILQLISGMLADHFGRRKVILFSMALFTLASLLCWQSTNIWMFLVCRLFQGWVIAGATISRAIIHDVAPRQEAASQLGYVAMAMSISPILGPVLGGLLEQWFGWRAGFMLYTIIGISLLSYCWYRLPETMVRNEEITEGQWVRYFRLLGSIRFWTYTTCMVFSVAAFFAFIGGITYIAKHDFGLPPVMLGVGIGVISIGFGIGGYLTGKVASSYSLVNLILAGRIFASVGLLAGIFGIVTEIASDWIVFGSAVLVGFGNGLTIPASSSDIMSVKPGLAGSASGLSGALVVGVGALFVTISGIMVVEGNGPLNLLIIMLLATLISLFAALVLKFMPSELQQ